ncbi:hypothetical protein [Halomonas sp. PBN3]|uniref:hypothetical protein n=1 Tax=Halomonas sp. PBN3 TaxID=1397528 RepID=UPI0003B91CBA|nr:hypothetical protein [Halomonas sp. PBN3]ERS88849.1 hypothetical protein Q671_08050 [Halomonas sp. PBN3]
MQVRTMGQGPHPDFSIAEGIVTVCGVAIDCAEHQADSQVIVDVRQKDGIAQLGGDGYQIASVRIPPRQYQEVEGEPMEGEEEPSTLREAQPLDPRQVEVTIWPAI